jgi:hypothetical protein
MLTLTLTFTLKEMNRKFDNLMHNYEVHVSTVSNRLDSSNAQSVYSEGLLENHASTILSLKQALKQKNEIFEAASEELKFERNKNIEGRRRTQKLYELVVALEG